MTRATPTGIDLVRDAVRPLLNRGFSLKREEQFDSFGDASVEVQNGNTIVRVVRDRGEYGVDMRAAHDRSGWHLAEVVLPLIGVGPIDRTLADGELAWTVEAIAEHFEGIDRLFAPGAYAGTCSRITAVETQRRKEMFGF